MSGRFGESSNDNISLSVENPQKNADLSEQFKMLVENPACYTRTGSVESVETTKPTGKNLSALAPSGGGRFGESSMAPNSLDIESTETSTETSTGESTNLKSDFKLLSTNPECYKGTGLPGVGITDKPHADASAPPNEKATEKVPKKELALIILPPPTPVGEPELTKQVIAKVKEIKEEVEVNEPASEVPMKALEKAKEKEAKAPEVESDVSKVISEVTTDTVVKTVIEAATSSKKIDGTKMYHLGTKYKPHLMGTGDPMKVKYCYGLAVTKNEASTDVETWMCPASDSFTCPTALTSQCKKTLVTSIPHSVNVSGTTENATFFNY